ncbi:hypothetical protein HDU92_001500 [Lobulomyces angularis]|nr:hypothetical protein HDU92_001500 [Lobulomyces angularis]
MSNNEIQLASNSNSNLINNISPPNQKFSSVECEENYVIVDDEVAENAGNKNLIQIINIPALISIFFISSVFGVFIRVKLLTLKNFNATFTIIYPQIFGTFLMGFFSRNKNYFTKGYLLLYTGLATGLCGSITTFSSWILDAFNKFVISDGSIAENVFKLK